MSAPMPGEGFVRGYSVGLQQRRDRERAEQEKEDRELAKRKLKFEQDRLTILDKEATRRAALEEAEFMEKMPGLPGPEAPTQDTPDGFVGPGFAPTELPHPPIEVPEGGYGQAPRTIQPSTRGQKLQEQIAGRIKEARGLRYRTVSGGVAKHIGVPEGDYDADILKEMGDTSRGREAQVGQTEREGMQNRTSIRVAEINAAARRAGSGGGSGPNGEFTDQDSDNWSRLLGSGEAKLPQVPKEIRTQVVSRLLGKNLAILTPAMEKRIGGFLEANSAVDKIEGSLQDFLEADGPEKLGRGFQYKAEITAFSRLIGRSLGEKGVFTDADKRDFEQIMGIGARIPIFGAAAGAYFAPELAQDRITQVRALMEKVKERAFQQFALQSGGRLPPGAVLGGKVQEGQPKTAEELLKLLKESGITVR